LEVKVASLALSIGSIELVRISIKFLVVAYFEMKTRNRNPKWLDYGKQIPLHERIYGCIYQHNILCSMGADKPIGTPGCIRLRMIADKKSK